MPVHSLHIFDRKGKTLFTKLYAAQQTTITEEDMDEQRKLIFGMLFSLTQVTASLASPTTNAKGLHSVKTGIATLYNYETPSGLRFAMYVVANSDTTTASSVALEQQTNASIRTALAHIYQNLWIHSVTQSPLYRPTQPNVNATNFEQQLDQFLSAQPWF
jgi:hypothetical protein